jgi:hypothetical protein
LALKHLWNDSLRHRRGLISGVRSRLLELGAADYFIADSVIVAACRVAGE